MPSRPEKPVSGGRDEKHLFVGGAALGLTAISTQIILLREILSVFYGNELIIGVVLADWMILTGAGALAARALARPGGRAATAPLLLITLAVLPPLTVVVLRCARNLVFTPGSMIGVVQASAGAFVLLAPFCLTSGFAFAYLAVTISRRQGSNRVGDVYAWESLGSAAGGLVFNILLIAFLTTFQALVVLAALELAVACFIARREGRPVLQLASILLLVAVIAAGVFVNADALTRSRLFPDQEILSVRDTPYGNLTVTRQAGQVNLYENSLLLTSSDDVTTDEESVHYALVQRSSPRRILLIGGGVAGTTREALKYRCERVDCVEINPWIISTVRQFVPIPDDPRVRIITEDARSYVAHTPERYDAVLVNLPDPGTAQLNRYATVEFFRQVRAIMNSGGVFATSLLPGAEYQGREARLLGSVVLSTLHKVFSNVLIVPGERNFFLASDSSLDIHIVRLIGASGVSTIYVNRYYLDDTLLEQRSNEITASLGGAGSVNTDFRPLAYFRQLQYWLSYFGFDAAWILIAAVVIWCLGFWRAGPVGAGIMAGGTSASSAQVLLLVAFQTLCGSLYQMTGFLIVAFMAGLAAGAGPLKKLTTASGMRVFIGTQVGVAVACFLLWPLLSALHASDLPVGALEMIFACTGFVIAALVGFEFSTAAELFGSDPGAGASSLYGLDLLGSALGALVVSVYVLPQFGLVSVSLLAGLVSLAGAARCAFTGWRPRVGEPERM